MRRHRILESAQGVHVQVDGHRFLAFSSNDYLGLANHPEIKACAASSMMNAGFGSGASHLVMGHHQEHAHLERELAEFTGRERALLFSSGYMANLALVSALVDKSDLVLHDRLNHASLLDGGLLSGARFQRYLHNDMHSVQSFLQKFSDQNKFKKMLVVTDGVFSMDGDLAKLDQLAVCCAQSEALLMVDDAHGLGVLGANGKGTLAHFGLSQNEVPVLMGTFGKAFGTSGAFVAGSDTLIEYLIQVARPYIYTTAMPPFLAAATRKSLHIIQEADDKRAHLAQIIAYFKRSMAATSYTLLPSDTPIQPVLIGDSVEVMKLAAFLEAQGLLVGAIRPPTVPENTARLRITFSASHRFEDVDVLVNALKKALEIGASSN